MNPAALNPKIVMLNGGVVINYLTWALTFYSSLIGIDTINAAFNTKPSSIILVKAF
jgi:hypothetical protein